MARNELFVGGFHAVEIALKRVPGDCLDLWVRRGLESEESQRILALAAAQGVAVQPVEARKLDQRYGDDHHQGVILRRRPPALSALEPCLETLQAGPAAPLILVLDHIEDPRNFGACLRVADGAGVDAVVFPRRRNATLGGVTAKAASGAIDTLNLIEVGNLANALRQIKAAGIWLTGTAASATATSLYQQDLTLASALVLGNEGRGLKQLTSSLCDHLVSIPMAGEIESLNLSTAAAVVLFEARRQRQASPA